jgi:hypothetical protein
MTSVSGASSQGVFAGLLLRKLPVAGFLSLQQLVQLLVLITAYVGAHGSTMDPVQLQ